MPVDDEIEKGDVCVPITSSVSVTVSRSWLHQRPEGSSMSLSGR